MTFVFYGKVFLRLSESAWFQFSVIYNRANRNRYGCACLCMCAASLCGFIRVFYTFSPQIKRPVSSHRVNCDQRFYVFIRGDSKNKRNRHYSMLKTIDMNVVALHEHKSIISFICLVWNSAVSIIHLVNVTNPLPVHFVRNGNWSLLGKCLGVFPDNTCPSIY